MSEGGCTCGHIRYGLIQTPLYVHCCHCTWCQRESGSAFAVNALIETKFVESLAGEPTFVTVPTQSGSGQVFARCPKCWVAVWSHYSGLGEEIAFIRTGTLDDPALYPPDIHIFTSTKQPHVKLGDDVPVKAEYYRRSEYWPIESRERFKALKSQA